jgi:formiminotetrahydrofolate cyclodeaminase
MFLHFISFQAAMKLPQGTEAEKSARAEAMDQGLRKAINVPLNLARHVNGVWQQLIEMARVGNINCKSDLQV